MSQENVEAVRSMYAGFSGLAHGGEIASFVAEHWDPECEYKPVEETVTIRGHDALIRWTERWLEVWDEYRDEIEEIIDAEGSSSLRSGFMAEVARAGWRSASGCSTSWSCATAESFE